MKTLMIAAVLGFAGAASAQGLEFKGVPFGVSQERFIEGAKAANTWFECRRVGMEMGDVWCSVRQETYAQEKVESIDAYFIGDRLGLIMITTKPESYEAIRDALAAKYLRPTERAGMVQNRMGAKYEQREANWRLRDGGTISLARYSDTLDAGLLTMQSRDHAAEHAKRRASKPAAKKDI